MYGACIRQRGWVGQQIVHAGSYMLSRETKVAENLDHLAFLP